MFVRVVKPHHALAPRVLANGMDKLHAAFPGQLGDKAVKIVLLKVELGITAPKGDLTRLGVEEFTPGIQGLQTDTTGQGHIGAKIYNNV